MVVAGEMIDGSTVMSSTSEKTVVDVVAEIAPAVATAEAMLVERRLSSTVSDTIGAEEIKGGMSSDAAEALEKVTGVTTMNDFVYVRGLDPRYSATTLNNAMLATTEPERRVVPLDLFPANLINNIKVLKTYSPDLQGEFSAGLVQVETTEFPTKLTFSVSYSIGFNDQTQGSAWLDYPGGGRDFFRLRRRLALAARRDPLRYARGSLQLFPRRAASGRQFSTNWERSTRDLNRPSMSWNVVAGNTFGKLGVVGALTFSNSLQTIFDQERNYYFPPPGYAQGVAGAPVLQSAFDYDESTESSRLGGVFNLSYQFSPAHKVAWRNFYSHDTDDNARYYEGYYQDFNTDIRNQRLRYIERTIQNSQVESEHLFKGPGQQRPDLVDGLLQGGPRRARSARKPANLRRGRFPFLRRQPERLPHVQRSRRDHPQSRRGHARSLLPRFVQRALKFGANYASRGRDFRSRRFRFNLRGSRGIDLTLPPNQLFAEENIRPWGFELNETTRITDAYRGVRDVFGY